MTKRVINKLNFFSGTIGEFKECKKPRKRPDFISTSGSKYWHFKDGVIRQSNHWTTITHNGEMLVKNVNVGPNTWGIKVKSEELKTNYIGYINYNSLV